MTVVSAIVPAYNEAERIASTIEAIRRIRDVTEIVVVDDGSSDATATIAEQAGADIVVKRPHLGKGAALNFGAGIAQGDIFLLLDADLGDTASLAQKILEPVRAGSADMSIATFPVIPGKGGGAGFVVRLARRGIASITGRVMNAPLSGQRALTRAMLEEIGGFAAGWGVEVALTVEALVRNYRVIEIPTEMTHRVTGKSPAAIAHRASQFVAAFRVLSALKIKHRRSNGS